MRSSVLDYNIIEPQRGWPTAVAREMLWKTNIVLSAWKIDLVCLPADSRREQRLCPRTTISCCVAVQFPLIFWNALNPVAHVVILTAPAATASHPRVVSAREPQSQHTRSLQSNTLPVRHTKYSARIDNMILQKQSPVNWSHPCDLVISCAGMPTSVQAMIHECNPPPTDTYLASSGIESREARASLTGCFSAIPKRDPRVLLFRFTVRSSDARHETWDVLQQCHRPCTSSGIIEMPLDQSAWQERVLFTLSAIVLHSRRRLYTMEPIFVLFCFLFLWHVPRN